MKKRKSIIYCISVVMVLVMTLLAGCGSKGGTLLGSWESDIDIADSIKQSMEQTDGEMAKDAVTEEMLEYINIDSCYIKLIYTFNDDGTYKSYVDEEKAKESIESVKDNVASGIRKYLEDYIKSSGLSISVDELLEQSGISIDELVNEAFGDENIQSIIDSAASEGKYEARDGKLYMSESLDEEIDENKYETYELSSNKLKIIDGFEDDGEGMDIYPVTFSRISK